jgi:DNA-directed RNA polymerase subunit RPC12/RpoP
MDRARERLGSRPRRPGPQRLPRPEPCEVQQGDIGTQSQTKPGRAGASMVRRVVPASAGAPIEGLVTNMNDKCKQCGGAIDRQQRPRSPWCSPHCSYRSRYVPRAKRPAAVGACAECGSPFEYPQTRGRPPKRCSHCRQAEQERRAAWRTGPHPHTRKPRPCEVCGALYKPSYFQQRTCGRSHGIELRRRMYGTAAGGRQPGGLQ